MELKLDSLESVDVVEFRQQRIQAMQAQTVTESVHALDIDACESSECEMND